MTVLPQTPERCTDEECSTPIVASPHAQATGGFARRRDGHGDAMGPSPTTSSRFSSGVSSRRMMAIYLRHHVAASRGGLDLFQRSARSQLRAETRGELRDLAGDVSQDRAQLLAILQRLGIPRPRMAEAVVGVAETLGRLKPNGTLVRRSPLSDVVELEALSTAVTAKRLGWVTLRVLAEHDHRFDATQLNDLIRRAEEQEDRLEALRRQAVADALGGVGSTG